MVSTVMLLALFVLNHDLYVKGGLQLVCPSSPSPFHSVIQRLRTCVHLGLEFHPAGNWQVLLSKMYNTKKLPMERFISMRCLT